MKQFESGVVWGVLLLVAGAHVLLTARGRSHG